MFDQATVHVTRFLTYGVISVHICGDYFRFIPKCSEHAQQLVYVVLQLVLKSQIITFNYDHV